MTPITSPGALLNRASHLLDGSQPQLTPADRIQGLAEIIQAGADGWTAGMDALAARADTALEIGMSMSIAHREATHGAANAIDQWADDIIQYTARDARRALGLASFLLRLTNGTPT